MAVDKQVNRRQSLFKRRNLTAKQDWLQTNKPIPGVQFNKARQEVGGQMRSSCLEECQQISMLCILHLSVLTDKTNVYQIKIAVELDDQLEEALPFQR